ncbi:hypothetical protein CDAR_115031, partial [Caerostris darwini]
HFSCYPDFSKEIFFS